MTPSWEKSTTPCAASTIAVVWPWRSTELTGDYVLRLICLYKCDNLKHVKPQALGIA